MQVGTFLGEEQFEFLPDAIAEDSWSNLYFLPMPAPEFIRSAFLADLQSRGIDIDAKSRRVAGELVRFDFPCEEVATKPPTLRCSMRFRFTVRDHDRVTFEKVYAPSVTIRKGKGQSAGDLAGQAFVQLLARVFGAFLEDPAVVAVFAAPPEPSPAEGPNSDAEIARAEGRGPHRKLKNNRIYFELLGRPLMGLYYDRKVLEYGYVGLGANVVPPTHPAHACEPNVQCGGGGIWAGPFVGLNTPNLARIRLFAELGLQRRLTGVSTPAGVSLNYSIGFAFQAPRGFDLQIGCTRFVPMDFDALCIPRLDLGGAF